MDLLKHLLRMTGIDPFICLVLAACLLLLGVLVPLELKLIARLVGGFLAEVDKARENAKKKD